MPAWTLQFLANLVTSLVISVFTAVLTVQLSLRRFQAERWWERKVDAYSRIIEALHHVMAFTEINVKESSLEVISKEHKAELESSYQKAMRDLRMVADVGAFIVSDDVAKILAELESPEEFLEVLSRFQDPAPEKLEAYPKALAKIRELAKRDLKVR